MRRAFALLLILKIATVSHAQLSGLIADSPSNVATKVPAIYVTLYGADPTGRADSTTAIQNALNAASASSTVRTVWFPSGTYKVTATLTKAPGVRMIGESRESGGLGNGSKIYASHVSGWVLSEDDHSRGEVSSFTEIANLAFGGTPSLGCIYLNDACQVSVNNCRIFTSGIGIDDDNASYGNRFESNYFSGDLTIAIEFTGSGSHNNEVLKQNLVSHASIAGLSMSCRGGDVECFADVWQSGATNIIIQGTASPGTYNVYRGFGEYYESANPTGISINPAGNAIGPVIDLNGGQVFGNSSAAQFINVAGPLLALKVDDLFDIGGESAGTFNFGTMIRSAASVTLSNVTSLAKVTVSSTPAVPNATDYVWRRGFTSWEYGYPVLTH